MIGIEEPDTEEAPDTGETAYEEENPETELREETVDFLVTLRTVGTETGDPPRDIRRWLVNTRFCSRTESCSQKICST